MPFTCSPEALVQLFVEEKNKFENIALSYMKDYALAFDIVQDALVAMLERERVFASRRDCVAYIKVVIRNNAVDELRKYARVQLYDNMNDISASMDEDMAYTESRLTLLRFLERYPPEMQEAFVLHVLDRVPSRLLAEEMHISHEVIRRRFSRMKRELLAQSDAKTIYFLCLLFLLSHFGAAKPFIR